MRDKKIRITVAIQRDNGLPDKWRRKLKAAAGKKSVKSRKAATCLRRYGVENPGVLGAYHSKEATKFIISFLNERGIPRSRARFHDSASGNKEFFQVITFNNRSRYVSYDLTVFKTDAAARRGDASNVETILEYNGPWHCSKEEVVGHENEPSVPYRGCRTTKLAAYLLERAKIERALAIANEVVVYWNSERRMQTVGSIEEF
jgi:hypothetical protein